MRPAPSPRRRRAFRQARIAAADIRQALTGRRARGAEPGWTLDTADPGDDRHLVRWTVRDTLTGDGDHTGHALHPDAREAAREAARQLAALADRYRDEMIAITGRRHGARRAALSAHAHEITRLAETVMRAGARDVDLSHGDGHAHACSLNVACEHAYQEGRRAAGRGELAWPGNPLPETGPAEWPRLHARHFNRGLRDAA